MASMLKIWSINFYNPLLIVHLIQFIFDYFQYYGKKELLNK